MCSTYWKVNSESVKYRLWEIEMRPKIGVQTDRQIQVKIFKKKTFFLSVGAMKLCLTLASKCRLKKKEKEKTRKRYTQINTHTQFALKSRWDESTRCDYAMHLLLERRSWWQLVMANADRKTKRERKGRQADHPMPDDTQSDNSRKNGEKRSS